MFLTVLCFSVGLWITRGWGCVCKFAIDCKLFEFFICVLRTIVREQCVELRGSQKHSSSFLLLFSLLYLLDSLPLSTWNSNRPSKGEIFHQATRLCLFDYKVFSAIGINGSFLAGCTFAHVEHLEIMSSLRLLNLGHHTKLLAVALHFVPRWPSWILFRISILMLCGITTRWW